jgi:hypothetical protein
MEVTCMKNTPRIHNKTSPNAAKSQPEKPSIRGQNAATIGHSHQDKLQALLNEKSGYELRIIGVIRRLSATYDPVEALVTDEIKAAVRAIFPHLALSEGDMAKYFADAERKASESPVCLDWMTVGEWVRNPN